ncbi:MAG: amidohydrolase [Synergistaceae bacterium]|jgi:aminobenzoyl-glutamate utilization protein A|nr:amidohydrolase [Synergistaceae bacterium]
MSILDSVDWGKLERDAVALRRDIHKHPEGAWTEFRTSAIIAERLEKLGWKLSVGLDNIDVKSVMGRPDDAVIDSHIERAKAQGGNPAWIDRMGKYTGVVADMDTGRPGPTVALRFDIDCVDVAEASEASHRPAKEGFASVNSCLTHACGHDAHTAIGLCVAEALAKLEPSLKGKVRLIFQPGEEGCRGAYAMVQKGVVDEADYFLALHIGGKVPSGVLGLKSLGYLGTAKFDAEFKGRSAHAAAAPQEGRNALLAAASATIALHGIAPHRDGPTRVNVGVFNAGTGRNVIPDHALIKAETRGETKEIADYVYARAMEILKGAAIMYGTELSVSKMGEGTTADSDDALAEKIGEAVRRLGIFKEVRDTAAGTGSEDATWMMRRVQERGGQAVYMALGSDIAAPHHNGSFDIDESAMINGVKAFAAAVAALLS